MFFHNEFLWLPLRAPPQKSAQSVKSVLVRASHLAWLFSVCRFFFPIQDKSDSSDAGKESSSDAGPDGQDGSSSSSSKTKESTAGYEEKVVRKYSVTRFTSLISSLSFANLITLASCDSSKQIGPTDLSTCWSKRSCSLISSNQPHRRPPPLPWRWSPDALASRRTRSRTCSLPESEYISQQNAFTTF